MEGKKKICMIVKSEETFGISLYVDEDFDEEYNSPVMMELIRDFPKSKRRVIFPQRDEVEMMNEGEDIKVEPEYYLNKDGEVKSLTK